MKQYFKAGKQYLEIDHKKQVFRWSQNSAWRMYIDIKLKDGKKMLVDLLNEGYSETDKPL